MCSGICQSCLHVWATTTRARTQHLDADNHARTCVILQLPTYVAGRAGLFSQYNPALSASIIRSLQACFSRCLSTTCCRPHTLGSLFLQASSPHWFIPTCLLLLPCMHLPSAVCDDHSLSKKVEMMERDKVISTTIVSSLLSTPCPSSLQAVLNF